MDNKVKLLVLLFGIFAIMLMQTYDVDARQQIIRTGQGTVNYTINTVNGSRLGDFNNTAVSANTVLLVIQANATTSAANNIGNWSIYGIFYNTSATTWVRLALTGTSGNSSCSGRTCNHTGNARGAMLVRVTLPADTYRGSFRVAQNRTAGQSGSVGAAFANMTNNSIVTIDNTVPTLTIASASSAGNNLQTTDDTPLIRIDGNENITSMQLFFAGRTYNMTRVDLDTFEYTFANIVPESSYSYTVRAGDYANSNNFQESTFGIKIDKGSRSPALRQQVQEIAARQGMFAGEAQGKEIAKTAGGAVVGGVIGGIVVPVIGIIPGAIVGGIIGFMF